ncbi:hypothetical protein [Pseudoxanthomonas sp.]|nr:hypothetical protein [Pseudoxanthomonas sp.]WDS36160.1 MAG: hypothetical protein O8I58_18105 [Pseudoxanthomonas sp.]
MNPASAGFFVGGVVKIALQARVLMAMTVVDWLLRLCMQVAGA